MLKIGTFPVLNLNNLSANHLKHVDGRYKTGQHTGQYRNNSITHRLTKALALATGEEKKLFDYLLNQKTITKIIEGTPHLLKAIIDEIAVSFPSIKFYQIVNHNILITSTGNKLQKIFDYKAFRKSKKCPELLGAFGLETAMPCVYCNLDDVSVVPIDNDDDLEKALLDIDHFYPKYKYPFLGLSFYNLIPSCHICNSSYKGTKDFELTTHVHPYLMDFDDLFKFQLSKPFDLSQKAIEIKIKCLKKTAFPDLSVTDLGLIQRYHGHRIILWKLLEKMYKEYKRVKSINDLFGSPNGARDIFELSHVPVQKNDLVLYKMGKLKRDILQDVGVF